VQNSAQQLHSIIQLVLDTIKIVFTSKFSKLTINFVIFDSVSCRFANMMISFDNDYIFHPVSQANKHADGICFKPAMLSERHFTHQ